MEQLSKSSSGSDRKADRAQSTVIGAILLIVVTIILISFVAVYVFDVGSQLQSDTPQASFTFEKQGNTLNTTHAGGDNIPAGDLEVVVNWQNGTTLRYSGTTVFTDKAANDDVAVGDRGTVPGNANQMDTVRVVYIDPTSGEGTALSQWQR